ncbi:Hypothetical protein, putative [Bodo saltans]|uniref:Sacsin/Nov domain-containing protein n=1 Tax=Bodo saltans TaxID=75058 RepID=A0A0S4JNR8_BODSA|nr:Hypothetical protein, putative [Bodo saltans]|eukprot:CUG91792.1 Hypothetical protein, putative [Bodo saltans]
MLFEQSQSVVSRIQQILREYPFGDAVLLELLQNADDAGAAFCHLNLIAPSPSSPCKVVESIIQEAIVSTCGKQSQATVQNITRSISQDLEYAVDAFQHRSRPVLEFFNNSAFTERDLTNIQSIGGSSDDSKKHDGTKVGRFGLGFNSAYHLSDVILFVSESALVVFDPSRTVLPPNNAGDPRSAGGYRWNYVDESRRLQQVLLDARTTLSDKDLFFLSLMHLLESSDMHFFSRRYEDNSSSSLDSDTVGTQGRVPFSRSTPYRGTLFRLPLRHKPSALWKERHSADEIAAMIGGFPDMAILGLVLTKQVHKFAAHVTLEANDSNNGTATSRYERHTLYCVVSNGWDESLREPKARCVQWLQAYTTAMLRVAEVSENQSSPANALEKCIEQLPDPEEVLLCIRIEMTSFPNYAKWSQNRVIGAATLLDTLRNARPRVQSANLPTCVTTEFTVAHQFGPGGGSEHSAPWRTSKVWEIAEECARYSHPISVPWGATIVENSGSLLVTTAENAADSETLRRSGRLMCFFPIRSATGLPVHIHGYFHLSSDRQSVASVDRSRWNAALCSEVIPFSYASAVQAMCVAFPKDGRTALHLWPLGAYQDDVTIELIALRTIAELATRPVFPYHARRSAQSKTSSVQVAKDVTGEHLYSFLNAVRCFETSAEHKLKSLPLLSSLTFDAYMLLLRMDETRVAQAQPMNRLLYVAGKNDFTNYLPRMLQTLARRGIAIPRIDAPFLREILSEVLQVKSLWNGLLPIPNVQLAVLLNSLLADGNYNSFLSMFHGSELQRHPLIPLISGSGVPAHEVALKDGTLFLASTKSIFDISCSIEPIRRRLVYFAASHAPATTGCEGILCRHIQALASSVQQGRLHAQCSVTTLNEGLLLQQLPNLIALERTFYESVQTNHQDASTKLSEWRLCFVEVNDVPCRGMVGVDGGVQQHLFRWMTSLNLSDYASLPLLPRTVAANENQQSLRRACVSPVDHVCIAFSLDGAKEMEYAPSSSLSSTASQEARNCFHILECLGAIELDTSVVPISDIRVWNKNSVITRGFFQNRNVNSFHDGIVAIISATNEGARNAVAVMRELVEGSSKRRGINTNWDHFLCLDTLTPDSAKVVTHPDLLRRYFARHQAQLTSSDKDFLSTLPLVRTIWPNRFVRSQEIVNKRQRTVLLVSKSLSSAIVALLRSAPLTQERLLSIVGKDNAFSSSSHWAVVISLVIMEREASDELTAAAASLLGGVAELADFDAALLGAAILGGPIPDDLAASPSSAWKDIITTLSRDLERSQHVGCGEVRNALRALLQNAPLFRKHQFQVDTNSGRTSDNDCFLSANGAINSQTIPVDLLILAKHAVGVPDTLNSLRFATIPPSLSTVPTLLKYLGVVEGITVAILTQLCETAGMFFTNYGPLPLSSDNAKLLLRLSRALLSSIDSACATAKEGDTFLSALGKFRIMPVMSMRSSAEYLCFGELGTAFVDDAFRLCPIDPAFECIHPALIRDIQASHPSEPPVTLREQYPNLNKRVYWYWKPHISSTLDYVAKMSSVTAPPPPSPGIIDQAPHRPTPSDWNAVLSYITETAKVGSDATFTQEVQKAFSKGLYSPELGVSMPLKTFSFDAATRSCRPILHHIDEDRKSRFDSLWSALQIPQQHTFENLSGILHGCREKLMAENCTQTAPVLPLPLLTAYVSVVELMVMSFPEKSRALCQSQKQLWLPVTNGTLELGHKLFYDISTVLPSIGGAAADAAPSIMENAHTVAHPLLAITVAKALALQYVGIHQVSQMQDATRLRNPRGNFRARGQHQKVTDSIKRILGDYSDHHSVILEMLQNADDAGARNVTFYLDTRSFDCSKPEELLGSEMVRCQGPSLVVVNDQRFTPADFDALLEIGCGHKASDPASIGRFGVGFNSVYRYTDCISIVSGEFTQFLDPAAAHLGCATAADPGLMLEHTKELALLRTFTPQFAPFSFYGVDFTQPFEGTLFRLPLRENVWENVSLCNQRFTPDDIRTLFTDFGRLLPQVLLFLKSVETISFCEVSSGKTDNSAPQRSFVSRVDIHDFTDGQPSFISGQPDKKCDALRSYRQDILASLGNKSEKRATAQHQCIVTVSVESKSPPRRESQRKAQSSWLLSSVVSDAHTLKLDCDAMIRKKLIPWGAVALCLSPVSSAGVSDHCNGGETGKRLPPHMRPIRTIDSMLHCSLPLPCLKGEFPFHVHGSFALTSDRRGMWTQSVSDQMPWEIQWNRFLLSQTVVTAAIRALEMHPLLPPYDSISSLEDALGKYFELFPLTHGAPQQANTEAFAFFRQGFFDELERSQAKLLWAHHVVRDAHVSTPGVSASTAITQRPNGEFVSMNGACCVVMAGKPEPQELQQQQQRQFDLPDQLAAFTIPHTLSLCRVSSRLYEELSAAAAPRKILLLSPELIANELFRRAGSSRTFYVAQSTIVPPLFAVTTPTSTATTTANTNTADTATTGRQRFDAAQCVALLAEYVFQLSDKKLIRGLPLVLLDDGTIGIVGKSVIPDEPSGAEQQRATNEEDGCIFLEGDDAAKKLFPLVPVVDRRYLSYLRVPRSARNLLHIAPLTLSNMSNLLRWFADPQLVATRGTRTNDSNAQKEFLANFWSFVENSSTLRGYRSNLSQADAMQPNAQHDLFNWCLIPALDDDHPVLVPLSHASSLVASHIPAGATENEKSELEGIRKIFGRLGVRTLDERFSHFTTIRSLLRIPRLGEKEGVTVVLDTALKNGRFRVLEVHQRDTLLTWLVKTFLQSKHDKLYKPPRESIVSIAKLPLFPVLKKFDCWDKELFEYQTLMMEDDGRPVISHAVIPGMPRQLSIGLHKRAISELNILPIDAVTFISKSVFNAFADTTTTFALTSTTVIQLLQLLSRHPNQLKSFVRVALVPQQRPASTVHSYRQQQSRGGISTLKRFATEWLADTCCWQPYQPDEEADKKRQWFENLRVDPKVKLREDLFTRIEESRYDHLNVIDRLPASAFIVFSEHDDDATKRPTMATIKEMMSLCKTGTFTLLPLPHLIADDIVIRPQLESLGVVVTPTKALLIEAAHALANYSTTMSLEYQKCTTFPETIRRLSHEIATSIVMFAKSSSVPSWDSIISSIQEIAFIVPHATGPSGITRAPTCRQPLTAVPMLVAPKNTAPFNDAWCTWLVQPVMPECFSSLCLPKYAPSVSRIVEQVSKFMLARHDDDIFTSIAFQDVNKAILASFSALEALSAYSQARKEIESAATSNQLQFPVPYYRTLTSSCEFVMNVDERVLPPTAVSISQIIVDETNCLGTLRPYFYHFKGSWSPRPSSTKSNSHGSHRMSTNNNNMLYFWTNCKSLIKKGHWCPSSRLESPSQIHPHSMRRIQPDALPFVHADIPWSTCDGLRIPSVSAVIEEGEHTVLSSSSEATTSVRSQREQASFQNFFESPLFFEVLRRLLRTHRQLESYRESNNTASRASNDTSFATAEEEVRSFLSHSAVNVLKHLQMRFVANISTQLFHCNSLDKDISSPTHPPHWSLQREENARTTILVRALPLRRPGATRGGRGGGRGLRGGATQIVETTEGHRQEHHRMPAHYSIAAALNEIMEQKVSSVMNPLSCVLEHVAASRDESGHGNDDDDDDDGPIDTQSHWSHIFP